MAITNWKSVGESAFEADMKRSQLALQAEQQRQNQARWEAERADRNRIREEEKQWRDKTYADQREDVKANRDFERQKWNAQREDVKQNRDFERQKWNTLRDDANYNRNFEQQKYLDRLDQDAFDNEIKAEKMNQQTALFEREMETYNQLKAKRDAEKEASRTSLAAAITYAIRNGDRDANGRIFLPVDALNVFNSELANATGVNRPGYKGLVLITKDASGNPLNGMQVALLRADGSAEVMPQSELAALVDTFSALKGEYDGLLNQLFPNQQNAQIDNGRYKYLSDEIRSLEEQLKNELSSKDNLNRFNRPGEVERLTQSLSDARKARSDYVNQVYSPRNTQTVIPGIPFKEDVEAYKRIDEMFPGGYLRRVVPESYDKPQVVKKYDKGLFSDEEDYEAEKESAQKPQKSEFMRELKTKNTNPYGYKVEEKRKSRD